MNKVTLTVRGMSCNHCVHSIENNVGKLNGIEEVVVYIENGKVDIVFDFSVVSLETIKETIEELGYDVEQI